MSFSKNSETSKNSVFYKVVKSVFPVITLFILTVTQNAFSQIRLPKLIVDGMVLQRETPVNIWGWAAAGEKVTLRFNNLSFQTETSTDGKWQIALPPQKAGGPFEMEISASNKLVLKDILFGDVWLCSGQSNMEYPMNRLIDKYAAEIAGCENSYIRQFKVPQKYDFNAPVDDYSAGSWVAVNPETILNFSGVAYFFAKELNAKYKIPVGIINATVGGSPAEAWMSTEALKEFPVYLAEAEKFKNQGYIIEIQQKEKKASEEWYAELNKKDKGLQSKPGWKDPVFDASFWPVMPVPSYWADHGLGEVNGVVWFRREFVVPVPMTGKPVRLFMGRIVDADSVFINGKFVGTTSYQYPQRNYKIHEDVLKPGKNVIVVRVVNNSGLGGFVKDKPYQLFAGNDTINLAGNWQYQLGCTMNPAPGQTFVQWKPTGLYNGMLAPANNYAVKGVAWYQGESNVERFQEYRKLLTALISDWRKKHDQDNLPFIFAQLPNFMEAKKQPAESNWASFRYEQLKTAQTVKNAAITCNIDLGEWNDIHPQNKQDVAKRLAYAARKLAYGETNLVASGPVYQSAKTKGNKIEISFYDCGSGLKTSDGSELKHFAIAGADMKFVWAKAVIEANKVIVWSKEIENPKFVRYAWSDNPENANLCNQEGFPAFPFTTGK